MYNFNDVMSTGYGYNDYVLPTEAHYGLTAYMDDRTVYVRAYNNTDTKLTVKSSSLENLDNNNGGTAQLDIDFDYMSINTGNFINGLFRFNATFSNDKTCYLYLYVNGTETKLCQVERLFAVDIKKYKDRREKINEFIEKNDIVPEDYLSTDDIYYPYPDMYSWHCDTQEWIDLSNTLVNDDWSDEYKAYTFVEWICENIAYGYFKLEVTQLSRPHYYKDFTGKYSTYATKIGVCDDFAHILDIMCRTHGIPSVAISSKDLKHAWNLVYINGRWIEIDITQFIKYGAYTESITDRMVLLLPSETSIYKLYGVIPHNHEYPSDLKIDTCCTLERFQ